MKKILFFIFIFHFLIVPVQAATLEEDVKKAVESFYGDYLEYLKTPVRGDYDERLIRWVSSHPQVSDEFKKVFKKTLQDARHADPELGLGYDPIINAQDYPDKGFRAADIKVNGDNATVTMEGIGWSGFRVTVGLVLRKTKWLINEIRR